MGTNTLSPAVDGKQMKTSDENQLITATCGDFVPRNVSTYAPQNQGGSLGTSSFGWLNAYIKKIFIGTIANTVTIEESSGNILFKSNGVLMRQMTGTPSAPVQSSSISQNSSSTSFVDVPGGSVSITTIGRPVWVGFLPDLTGPSYVVPNLTQSVGNTANGFNAFFKILRGATTVGHIGFGQTAALGTTGTTTYLYHSPSSVYTIDQPAAGTYTYKIQYCVALVAAVVGSPTPNIGINNCLFSAYEMTGG